MNTEINIRKDGDIDVKELFSLIWQTKKIFTAMMILFGVISIIYSLSLPNLYTSESLVTVSSRDQGSSSGSEAFSSSFSGIASAAGISIGSPGGSTRQALAIATMESRDFFKHLITFEDVLPSIMAAKKYDLNSQSIIFDEKAYDAELKEWRLSKPSYLEAYKIYRQILKINLDKKSGFINIKIEHISPAFSYNFLTLIFHEVNSTVREKELAESQLALEYLNGILNKTKQIDTRLAIAKLIESQLKTQMLANVRPNYLLNPIDEAFLPVYKSNPARLRIVIMGLILGLGIYILGLLIRLIFTRK